MAPFIGTLDQAQGTLEVRPEVVKRISMKNVGVYVLLFVCMVHLTILLIILLYISSTHIALYQGHVEQWQFIDISGQKFETQEKETRP